MALLIDGHNLIGAGVFEDIALADQDDEAKLVARLKVWRSRYRGKITVVFDRGIPGGRDRNLSGGGVEVVFAATPVEADDLIRRRLSRRPKDLELVSNDAALVATAAAYGVPALSGSELVERFTFAEAEPEEPGEESDVSLSAEELEDWMDLFAAQPRRRVSRPRRLWPRKRRK
jgi:predicted RNA-binding protein with PIN domain